MKRYIRASEDSDNFIKWLNEKNSIDEEIKGLAESFKELDDEDEDSKVDFIAQHIYDMLHDIEFDEIFDYVESKIKK